MGFSFRPCFPVFIHVCHNPRLLVGQMVGHKGKNMARQTSRLSARKVDTLSEPGRYADGGNLYVGTDLVST